MSASPSPWWQTVAAALPAAALPPEQAARLGCLLAQNLESLHRSGYAASRLRAADTLDRLAALALHGEGPAHPPDAAEVQADLRGLATVLRQALTGQTDGCLPASPRALCGIVALLLQNEAPRSYRSAAAARLDLQLALELLQGGRPHDTFSLARREPAPHAA